MVEEALMTNNEEDLAITVNIRPGERLSLPADLLDKVGPGRWIVTVRPLGGPPSAARRHDAFLSGYAPSDEGLYDDIAG